VKDAGVIVANWVQAIATALIFVIVGREIDLVHGGSQLGVTELIAGAGLAVVVGVAAWASPALSYRHQARDERTGRRRVAAHIIGLGPVPRSREEAGAVVSTATDATERAATYRSVFLIPMIGSVTALLGVIVVIAVAITPASALWLCLGIPLIPLAVGSFQMAFRGVSRRYRQASQRLSSQFLEAIQGLPTLRLMNADANHRRGLAAAAQRVRRQVMALLAGNQLMLIVVDSLFSVAFLVMAVWLALTQLSDTVVTVGQAISLVLISTLLLEPLDQIGQFFYLGMSGMAAKKEIAAFLARPSLVPSVEVMSNAGDQTEHDENRLSNIAAFSTGEPAVSLEGVDFAYDPNQPVLQNLDLRIDQGEHLGLAGPSGVGKSTVAALIQGYRHADKGTVRLLGIDVSTADQSWLLKQTAVVAQRSYLFTGTIRSNLAMAAPDASDERLLAALAQAGFGHLTDELPDGLDTRVGERGMTLSGGQAQRIALAQALLKDAPVMILDEPTAHVDLASERAMMEALERIGRDKTILMITHRRSAIAAMDRTVLMEGASTGDRSAEGLPQQAILLNSSSLLGSTEVSHA
jgi:ATP-binding cassette subfamily C protein CydD